MNQDEINEQITKEFKRRSFKEAEWPQMMILTQDTVQLSPEDIEALKEELKKFPQMDADEKELSIFNEWESMNYTKRSKEDHTKDIRDFLNSRKEQETE